MSNFGWFLIKDSPKTLTWPTPPHQDQYKCIVAGLFNNETDPDVVRLREMFESILVKYLLYNYKKFSKMNEMKNVKMIVDQLENLSKMVK